jgi:hypothetical protein
VYIPTSLLNHPSSGIVETPVILNKSVVYLNNSTIYLDNSVIYIKTIIN